MTDAVDKIKVLFLDIDGVLNRNGYSVGKILPECVEHLNRIVEDTGCKIVLSSSWRQSIYFGIVSIDGFSWMLRSHNIKENLYSYTQKECHTVSRGHQIKNWLLEHPEVESYVVVDDSDESSFEGLCLVRTGYKEGLTSKNADDIVKKLGKKSSL